MPESRDEDVGQTASRRRRVPGRPTGCPAVLKVVHAFKVYAPEVVGGIPEVIRMLAAGLAETCHSRVLVSRMRGRGCVETIGGIPVRRAFSLGSLQSMPLSPSYPAWLWAAARNADLLVLHAPFPLIDLAVSLHFPRHTALIVHWHADIVAQRRLLPLVAPLIRRTLARADRIIVSSPGMIDGSDLLRPFAAKCTVVPFGVDAAAWSMLSPEETSRVAALRARSPRLVVAVGRLVRYKGFDVLLEAMREVDADLVIVGVGPLEDALRRQVAASGLAERVRIAGFLPQPELKCLLHASRAFVLPSVAANEAFGIVQLEAMACGKPVVNTRLATGVPWVARDGIEAVTVGPGNVAALAGALRGLLDDPGWATRLGQAGLRRATGLFAQTTFLASMRAVYHTAVQARRRRVAGEPQCDATLDLPGRVPEQLPGP